MLSGLQSACLPTCSALVDLSAAAQVHLGKKLPNGESRSYDISEGEFHELSFQFQRFSGAMLANIVNTAVILAGREGRTVIKYHDLTRVRSREGLHVCRGAAQRRALHCCTMALCLQPPAPRLLVCICTGQHWEHCRHAGRA